MQDKLLKSYFLSQPHQAFFMLGVVNAIVMMLLFGLSYKGLLFLNMNITLFHIYTLSFLVFHNLFTGFLFTTFPRFNQTPVIEKKFYIAVFFTNAVGTLLFLAGLFSSEYLITAAMVLLFGAQIFTLAKLQSIYIKGTAPDKSDSFWILIAQYFGLFANLLFILTHELQLYTLLPTATNISFYLYLIFLAFSVGQRMIPFFSHSWAQKNKHFVLAVFILFLFKSIASSAGLQLAEMLVDIVLALYMLKEFLRWEFHPLQSPSILWVLHLGLFWLPAAFGISAMTLAAELFLNTSFYFLNIHLLALGFLTTVLIGFGTRVTLGHSGQAPHADRFTTGLFFFVQFIVFARTLFSISIAFGWNTPYFFDIAFSSWIVLFVLWIARYGRVLLFKKQL
jgi:uncharacterized protein involved in response to NO